MPKIRCKGCETVLNVPDKARGKVIACSKCGTKMKLPGAPPADKGSPAAPAKSKKKPTSSSDFDQGNILAKLDLNALELEDRDQKICPYCAAALDPEDPVCRGCGMNVETRQMDAKEKKRRSLKGPDPFKYYSNVFKESWEFLMQEKGLALRTGMYWTLFSALHATCAYMGLVYCQRGPTKTFWISLMILTGLGVPGWYLYLGLKVISSSLLKEPLRSDRIHFDFFLAIAAGTRSVFWPLIVMGPFTPLFLVSAFLLGMQFQSMEFVIAAAILWLAIPILVLPLALIHMTARYTYKAWILWELAKLWVQNAAPTLYFLALAVVILLPLALVAVPLFYVMGTVNPYVSESVLGVTDKITLWIMRLLDLGNTPTGFSYAAIKGLLNLSATFILFAPICFVAAFPALFLMKANGLLGYYNQHSIDLVQRILPGTPATFWVRYLSHTIDGLFMPLAGIVVAANQKALMVQWLVMGVGLVVLLFVKDMLLIYLVILFLYTTWFYWAVQESSDLRATLGKDAFGLIVVTENDKKLTLKQASAKWALRLIFDCLTFPYLSAVFPPEKRALHDIITKTKVVWKGDK